MTDRRHRDASTIDRALFGNFGMKLTSEQVVEKSGTGWTTLQATQFHDLILTVGRALARLPAPGRHPAPAGRRHGRMAELALDEPSGLVPDLAGPKIYTVAELVNSCLSVVGKRRRLVPVRIAGQTARAIRAGANRARIARRQADVGGNSWPTGFRWQPRLRARRLLTGSGVYRSRASVRAALQQAILWG